MEDLHWQHGRFSAALSLIVGATLAGCGIKTQVKQAMGVVIKRPDRVFEQLLRRIRDLAAETAVSK